MENLIKLLLKANGIIKKRHRYHCGLEDEETAKTLQSDTGVHKDRARFFFLSPDGQNGELYQELRKLGLINAGYSAEYYWKLRERGTGWFLTYTEGDIDIFQYENKEENAIYADRACENLSHKHAWLRIV